MLGSLCSMSDRLTKSSQRYLTINQKSLGAKPMYKDDLLYNPNESHIQNRNHRKDKNTTQLLSSKYHVDESVDPPWGNYFNFFSFRWKDKCIKELGSFIEAVYRYFLLLKVPAVLLIDEDKVQVILHTEFVVYVTMCRCQFIRAKEQSDGNWLACKTSTSFHHY